MKRPWKERRKHIARGRSFPATEAGLTALTARLLSYFDDMTFAPLDKEWSSFAIAADFWKNRAFYDFATKVNLQVYKGTAEWVLAVLDPSYGDYHKATGRFPLLSSWDMASAEDYIGLLSRSHGESGDHSILATAQTVIVYSMESASKGWAALFDPGAGTATFRARPTLLAKAGNYYRSLIS